MLKDFNFRFCLLCTAGIFLLLLTACVTGSLPVNPLYATRTVRSVTGELAFGTVEQPENRYGYSNSMGAVSLASPVASFCSGSLQQELEHYGFSLVENAPLRVNAVIRQADTVWQQQGRAGVLQVHLFYLSFF